MKKAFFIIPGFKQKFDDPHFKWLTTYLKDKQFEVFCVPIDWDHKTISDYMEQFKLFYYKYKNEENYILGFSYGAVITFMTAMELMPQKIFLCSLSSDFKEDAKSMPPAVVRYIGKRRFTEIKYRSAIATARNLTIPSVVFYGEKEGIEYPQLKKRCEETARIAKNSKLVIVKNSPHDISYPEYIESIKDELSREILH